MGLLFYQLFIAVYAAGIRIASIWNPKARLWVKGRKNFPVFDQPGKTIWMHCASLGEFEQGRPVLEAIRKEFPQCRIVLSFFSPSGYEIRKNYSGADQVIYIPLDTAANARKLISSMNPSLVLWVKYEYWFHYLAELKKREIPVILVSGIFRPSQPFFQWYGEIWRKMLTCFRMLFVQNKASLEMLQSAGIAANAEVAGDTRFDRVIDIAERKEEVEHIRNFIGNHRVLVAGSTWEDDETELIHYVKQHPEIKFIIAPHEIDEANLKDVKREFEGSVFYSDYTNGKVIPEKCNVLIIDNIGMLSRLYRYADVTYIGGGFGSDGIHNTLEAAVYSKPVVFGPVYQKFAEARGLVEAGGAFSIQNALELEKLLDRLFGDPAFLQSTGEKSGRYVYSMKGATQKIIRYVNENRLLTN